jgi:hypothetical protein
MNRSRLRFAATDPRFLQGKEAQEFPLEQACPEKAFLARRHDIAMHARHHHTARDMDQQLKAIALAVQDQAITPEELVDNLNEVTGLDMEAASPDERMDRQLEKQATMFGGDPSIEGYAPGAQAGGGGVEETLGQSGGAYKRDAILEALRDLAKMQPAAKANGKLGKAKPGQSRMDHLGRKVFPNRGAVPAHKRSPRARQPRPH